MNYRTAGDNLPTVLGTAVAGRQPARHRLHRPARDHPGLRDPGRGSAARLRPGRGGRATSAESVADTATFDGQLYGILFKAANKSLGWYNTQVFEDAGVEPPATYEDLAAAADTIKASGVTPYSVAGADGWTLTDLFENIYLRTAGAGDVRPARAPRDPVDRPHRGRRPRPDEDRHRHRRQHRRWRARGAAAGQPAGGAAALHRPPKAAMYFEGDFVLDEHHPRDGRPAGPATACSPSPRSTAPRRRSWAPATSRVHVQGLPGGPGVHHLPDDARGRRGLGVARGVPRARTRTSTRASTRTTSPGRSRPTWPRRRPSASTCRTWRRRRSARRRAQGEWKILQDYLANPGDPQAVAQQLEQAAVRAD